MYLLQLRPRQALQLILGGKVRVNLAKVVAFVRECRFQIALYPRILAAGLRKPVLATSNLVPLIPPRERTPIRE